MATPWDLFRRGELDKERHHAKVQQAIRDNLTDLVGASDIIGEGAQGKVRIPVREFREYRFRHASGQGTAVGSANPRPSKGDVIGRLPDPKAKGQGPGQGPGQGTAGEGHDEGYYEVEIGLPEVASILFQDLELPNLREVAKAAKPSDDELPEGLNRRGSLSQLDVRRTLQASLLRRAMQGQRRLGGFTDEDLRFQETVQAPSQMDQVAVIFIRDRSGSMGDREKHLSRTLAFWALSFLRHKYGAQVTPLYILHDTEAELVGEQDFFHRTQGGGTAISSSYTLAERIIHKEYPPASWNLYAIHFSDGDNLHSDNELAVGSIGRLLPHLNLFCYCEFADNTSTYGYAQSHRFSRFLTQSPAGRHPACEIRSATNEQGVIEALRHFFRKRGVSS